MALRVAIGCSNPLFNEGLKSLLEEDRDIKVIGMYIGGRGIFSSMVEIANLKPDVILADYNSDVDHIFKIPYNILLACRLRILLLGDRSVGLIADSQLKELIMKGLVGILPPSADADLLKKALRAVSSGELWMDRNTIMKLLYCMKQPERYQGLAIREKEIVSHICQGYRNREIARKLNISEQTVKSHCSRIYRKLGVSDRLQLALFSHRLLPDLNKTTKVVK